MLANLESDTPFAIAPQILGGSYRLGLGAKVIAILCVAEKMSSGTL